MVHEQSHYVADRLRAGWPTKNVFKLAMHERDILHYRESIRPLRPTHSSLRTFLME